MARKIYVDVILKQDKGGNTQFNVTRGGRSGQQIKHY